MCTHKHSGLNALPSPSRKLAKQMRMRCDDRERHVLRNNSEALAHCSTSTRSSSTFAFASSAQLLSLRMCVLTARSVSVLSILACFERNYFLPSNIRWSVFISVLVCVCVHVIVSCVYVSRISTGVCVFFMLSSAKYYSTICNTLSH